MRISRLNFSVAHRPTANLLHICLFLPCLLNFGTRELDSEPFLRPQVAQPALLADLHGLSAPLLQHFAREILPDGLGAGLPVASAAVRPGLRRQPDLWPFIFGTAADSVRLVADRLCVGVRLAFYAIFLENADI